MLDMSSERLAASPAALLPCLLSGCTQFKAPRAFPLADKAGTRQFCDHHKAWPCREAQLGLQSLWCQYGLTPTMGWQHQEGINLCCKAQQRPHHTNKPQSYNSGCCLVGVALLRGSAADLKSSMADRGVLGSKGSASCHCRHQCLLCQCDGRSGGEALLCLWPIQSEILNFSLASTGKRSTGS